MARSWTADAGVTLDPRAEVPIGVQLAWSLRAAIAAGRLRPGERLPGLRELADELGVNHNTLRAVVARLEGDGLLERRHGTGTFVAADVAAHARHAPLVEQVVTWAADAGLSPRDLAAALYVSDAPAPRKRDAAVEERRALRDDIAVLERVLAQIEPPFAARAAEEEQGRPGARMLTAEDLREQRTALVRRLAAAQRMLDGEDETAPEPEAQPAPVKRRPRPSPVPRAQPT